MTFALLILLGVGLLFVSCRDNSEKLRKENIKLHSQNDSLRALIAKYTQFTKKPEDDSTLAPTPKKQKNKLNKITKSETKKSEKEKRGKGIFSKQGVVLMNYRIQREENGLSYIVGTVKNTTDKELSQVGVYFNLYDKDGAQIGYAVDVTFNFEANSVWKFKTFPITEDSVETCKIKDIGIIDY